MSDTRDPLAGAFPLLPNDWLAGTQMMTLKERGAYITLLVYAWHHDGLPDDERALAKICGMRVRSFRQIWTKLAAKFPPKCQGHLTNRKLERVRVLWHKHCQVRTYVQDLDQGTGTARARDPRPTPVEPVETVENAGVPSLWKRALAVAHQIADEYPNPADWPEHFKSRAAQQRLPYDAPGPHDRRPLHARALEYVELVREERREGRRR
jgi:hypothetical protein